MAQYTKGGMWCSRCGRHVMGVKNTHRARNTLGVGGALMTGGLSLLVAKREGYHCPTCGGPVHSAVLHQVGQRLATKQSPTQTAILELGSAPRDKWLNEVVAAVAELGLAERSRGMESNLGPGIDVECEIELAAAGRCVLRVVLFADDELASQAEMMVRTLSGSNYGVSSGTWAPRAVGRVLYVAYDTQRHAPDVLENAARAVSAFPLPPPIDVPPNRPDTPDSSDPDPVEQLRKLGELRSAGVLTDEEFNVKRRNYSGVSDEQASR